MGSWRRRAHASIQLRWLAMMTHGPFGSRSRPATFQSNASRMSDPTVARRNRNAGVARGVTGRTPARGRLAEAVDDICRNTVLRLGATCRPVRNARARLEQSRVELVGALDAGEVIARDLDDLRAPQHAGHLTLSVGPDHRVQRRDDDRRGLVDRAEP